MATFSVDLAARTVLFTDENGETFDLNASGVPCADLADLAAWIRELCEQGMYDAATRDDLLNALL